MNNQIFFGLWAGVDSFRGGSLNFSFVTKYVEKKTFVSFCFETI